MIIFQAFALIIVMVEIQTGNIQERTLLLCVLTTRPGDDQLRFKCDLFFSETLTV